MYRQVIDGLYLSEDLADARKAVDNLRRLQHSRLYAHPGTTSRDQISTTRRGADRNYALLKKKLVSRSKKLSRLPDPERLLLDLENDWQKDNEALGDYFGNVEAWLESVDPLTRPIVSEAQKRMQEQRAGQRSQ